MLEGIVLFTKKKKVGRENVKERNTFFLSFFLKRGKGVYRRFERRVSCRYYYHLLYPSYLRTELCLGDFELRDFYSC